MTSDDLPEDVLAAIHSRRKIQAIKLLREQRQLDLKTAKETVEAYMAGHPELAGRGDRAHTGLGRLVLVIVVLAALFAWYNNQA